MPSRDWTFRINDILAAIASIQSYVADMTYEAFVADRKTVDAVIRNFSQFAIPGLIRSPVLQKSRRFWTRQ
jgi:uncharacterized protein with HEPN domain